MGLATPIGGRPTTRRHRALIAVAGAITLVGLGVGQLGIAWASADTGGTADVTADFTTDFTLASADSLAGSTPNEGPPAGSAAAGTGASHVSLALPSTLQLDSPAEAAVHVAVLDARIAALDAALTEADAAVVASAGKADETLRAPLADATETLRSLRGQRTHPGIPGATAAVVRLTGPVLAAAAAYDVEQARLAAVAAESARVAAEAARVAAAAAAGGASGADPTNAGGSDLTAVGEATLRSLPGNGGVHLAWNHAAIGSHLGGVFLDQQTEIMINGRRLAGTPGRTASVVKHEMGHIYQARIIAAEASARGGWSASYAAMTARLNAVFGGNGQEKSADCVALRFGATWVAYSSDCGGDRQAAVDALLAGRMP